MPQLLKGPIMGPQGKSLWLGNKPAAGLHWVGLSWPPPWCSQRKEVPREPLASLDQSCHGLWRKNGTDALQPTTWTLLLRTSHHLETTPATLSMRDGCQRVELMRRRLGSKER